MHHGDIAAVAAGSSRRHDSSSSSVTIAFTLPSHRWMCLMVNDSSNSIIGDRRGEMPHGFDGAGILAAAVGDRNGEASAKGDADADGDAASQDSPQAWSLPSAVTIK